MLSTKRPPCLIDAEDQFVGVQEDSERDYMVETRGKDKTVMWLEVQPYGTPRQPEGPAQAPDPRLKEKGHKGSKSSKGSKAMASQARLNRCRNGVDDGDLVTVRWLTGNARRLRSCRPQEPSVHKQRRKRGRPGTKQQQFSAVWCQTNSGRCARICGLSRT